jgi:hypothetical protein
MKIRALDDDDDDDWDGGDDTPEPSPRPNTAVPPSDTSDPVSRYAEQFANTFVHPDPWHLIDFPDGRDDYRLLDQNLSFGQLNVSDTDALRLMDNDTATTYLVGGRATFTDLVPSWESVKFATEMAGVGLGIGFLTAALGTELGVAAVYEAMFVGAEEGFEAGFEANEQAEDAESRGSALDSLLHNHFADIPTTTPSPIPNYSPDFLGPYEKFK